MEEEDRARVWVLYGWFSGLMCVGSVFGAVTWAFWMQALVASFTALDANPRLPPAQSYLLGAQTQYWSAAFYVTYAIEFLCLSVAKLLVLHRMADFALAKVDGMSRRLAVGGRVVMSAVVAGNVVGLGGNVATAMYYQRSAEYISVQHLPRSPSTTFSVGGHMSRRPGLRPLKNWSPTKQQKLESKLGRSGGVLA